MTEQSMEIQVARLADGVERVQADITEVKNMIRQESEDHRKEYVSRAEFLPVQKLVYGLVALVMTAVILAMIGLVIVK